MLWKRLLQLSAVCALLLGVVAPPPVAASGLQQPVLVRAAPEPGAVLGAPPDAVLLTFDRALSDEGSWITVKDQDGGRVNEGDGLIDPSNRLVLSAPLPPLPEGRYRVTYQAAAIGGSTMIAGAYEFSVDLPEPGLELLQPVNGQAFSETRVPLEMRVHFFDFGQYDNRVHVYVDGQKAAELRGQTGELGGLEPGVHEIEVVLARLDGEELEQTAQRVTIAVAQPGGASPSPESPASSAAGADPPLSTGQWAGAAALTAVLLGIGLWLGRATQPPVGSPRPGDDSPPEPGR